MALNIEKSIESGVVKELKKVTYIVTNSIPVIEFRDNTAAAVKKYCVVHAMPVRRMQPNFNMWECEVEIICITHIPNDKNCSILDDLYESAMVLINSITVATLGTATGITIDGIVNDTAGEESITGDYQTRSAKAKIYLQKST